MRKLIMSNTISVDGFFEGPDKDLSGFNFDNESWEILAIIFDRADTILLGRETYEFFEQYWPTKTRETDPPADFMNNYTKIVFSKTLTKAPWGEWKEAVVVKDNLEDYVSKLKQKQGKDIVIFGSSSLVTALAQADLIDEYRFMVSPVILGSGNQLFKQITTKLPLTLKATTALKCGIVLLVYERERNH